MYASAVKTVSCKMILVKKYGAEGFRLRCAIIAGAGLRYACMCFLAGRNAVLLDHL